jgi:hypothetical protein
MACKGVGSQRIVEAYLTPLIPRPTTPQTNRIECTIRVFAVYEAVNARHNLQPRGTNDRPRKFLHFRIFRFVAKECQSPSGHSEIHFDDVQVLSLRFAQRQITASDLRRLSVLVRLIAAVFKNRFADF